MSTVSTRESRKAIHSAADGKDIGPKELKGFQMPSQLARKKPALIALCIALAMVGGLLTYFGMSGNGQVSVLVMKTDLARGAVIGAGDLTTIEVVEKSAGESIPADRSATVIGQKALVDLPEGSLVTAKNMGESLGVQSGSSVVGVGLASSQAPSRPLRAGDHVRIIRTPTQGATTDQNIPPISGVVDSTSLDDVKGLVIVDVVVSTDDAPKVVAWSASGNAGLILDPLTEAGK